MADGSEVDVAVGIQLSDGVEVRLEWTQEISHQGLRRGMRDALRDGAGDGNETVIGGLRPMGKPDRF